MYFSRSRLFERKVSLYYAITIGIFGFKRYFQHFFIKEKLCTTFFYRNFLNFSVALFGNCFTFNTEYNENKDEAAGKRVSSLTGPSFGLNLVVELDIFNYLKGNITKHVSITEL